MDEIEDVILALKAAGWAVPTYKILDDGVIYFDSRPEERTNPPVHSYQPGDSVG
jgi:hypothetical protein